MRLKVGFLNKKDYYFLALSRLLEDDIDDNKCTNIADLRLKVILIKTFY